MRVLITGADGFLGWHTRLRLDALTEHAVVPVGRSNWEELPLLAENADAILHLAGINRGPDEDVEAGNVRLARDVAAAVCTAAPGIRVVYANTVRATEDTPYGRGKRAASELLRKVATERGGVFTDVMLPNIFGEHARPGYNSFVATFIDAVLGERSPAIMDRPIALLPAQEAAASILGALDVYGSNVVTPRAQSTSVGEVWELLHAHHKAYSRGCFPDLSSPFKVALFNAYRAARFPKGVPIQLEPHSDERGTFFETVKSISGEGQTSFSTTRPGFTRGNHYHLTKIERFVVLRGRARISLRRMFDSTIYDFDVSGDRPVAIDMPTGWAHAITNIGHEDLLTQFWSSELFRPAAPDTYPAAVHQRSQ